MSQRIILLHWDPFIPGSNWCWTISSYAEIETADIVNPPINKKETPPAVPIDFFPFAVFTFRYSYNIVYPRMPTYDTPTYDTFFENFQNVISWHILDFENEKRKNDLKRASRFSAIGIIPSILSIFKGNGDQKVFFSVDIPSMASLDHLESITTKQI